VLSSLSGQMTVTEYSTSHSSISSVAGLREVSTRKNSALDGSRIWSSRAWYMYDVLSRVYGSGMRTNRNAITWSYRMLNAGTPEGGATGQGVKMR
jgi:hypothetical protein